MQSIHYIILEAEQPVDGEILTMAQLRKKLPYADHDAEVVAWDMNELVRDLATSLRVVTEDVVTAWWENGGAAEVMARIEAGHMPGLAQRFYPEECAGYERRVEAA